MIRTSPNSLAPVAMETKAMEARDIQYKGSVRSDLITSSILLRNV